MKRLLQIFILTILVAFFGRDALAQQSQVTTITEPGIYEISDLFKKSDAVVLAKVVAGDTESYDVAIYKAQVIKSFKGAADSGTIYFGPFIGEKLGWEYVLFLRNVIKPVAPKTASGGYGTVHYAEVFNEGYSSMMNSYECVFDGKEISAQCDSGVRVCTDYVKLPKTMRTFPPKTQDTPFGCRWVRKSAFMSLLKKLGGAN
jgi:hypothetical protein